MVFAQRPKFGVPLPYTLDVYNVFVVKYAAAHVSKRPDMRLVRKNQNVLYTGPARCDLGYLRPDGEGNADGE